MEGRLLVATSSVRLLRIPMYLLRQQNASNIWLRIKQFLDSRIPTNEELLQRYVEEKEWVKYRRRFCDALLTKQIPNNTTIHDTPYYWRVKKMDLDEVDKEGRQAKARETMERRKQTTESDIKQKERAAAMRVSFYDGPRRKSTYSESDRSRRIRSTVTVLSDHPADNEDASDTVTII